MTTNPTAPAPSLTALSEAFGRKTLKPSDVVEAQLKRIAKRDPVLGSYQAVYADDAMQAAKAADLAIAAGHRIGPFHGISFALKETLTLLFHHRPTKSPSTVEASPLAHRPADQT